MHIKVVVCRVAGVTFDNRQEVIQRLHGDEPCRIVPEPENQYDANALAVYAAEHDGTISHVGYVPRDLAAIIAPMLDGEAVMARLRGITGGFETRFQGTAYFGLQLEVQYPSDEGDL